MAFLAQVSLAIASAIRYWPHRSQRLRAQLFLLGMAFDILRAADQFAASTALIPRLQTLWRDLYPGRPRGLAGARYTVQSTTWALALIKSGEIDTGENLIQTALYWFSTQRIEVNVMWGACLMNFGCELLHLERLAVGIEWLERARNILSRVLEADAEMVLQCRSNLGVGYQLAGRLAESAGELKAALACHRAKGKWHSEEAIGVENNLAQTLVLMGQPDEAMQHARHAVDLAQKWRDGRFGSTLDTLADVYEAQGKLLEALRTRAGAIARIHLAGQESSKALWLKKHAVLLQRMGRAVEAEQYRRVLARLEDQMYIQLVKTTRAGGMTAE